MIKRSEYISFITITRREILRIWRIIGQVIIPPVMTMSLYFLIFGTLIGSKIGPIQGLPYAQYIAPGLIMMSVIINSYSSVSGSFYSNRFQRNIEELLISPTPNYLILAGYVAGGVFRGLVIAILITLVTLFFIPFKMVHPFITLLVVTLTSIFFSLAGFTNALFAKSFDDLMLIPNFVLTPLTYLGGIFYSVDMLSPFWSRVSSINPVLYMIDAFRYGMLGISTVAISYAISVLILCVVTLFLINLHCLNKGIGLKE